MIVAALEDGPELVRVIHLRTVHMGPDAVLVAAKIAVPESDTAAQVTAGIDAAERRVRARRPDRHDDLPGAGHLPPAAGRPHRPLHPRRPAQPLIPPARAATAPAPLAPPATPTPRQPRAPQRPSLSTEPRPGAIPGATVPV